MTPNVAVIAAGNMGAAVGARLVEHGLRVITSLDGRSPASAERAAASGIADATDEDIAQTDFILSIVPPRDAISLAERLAPVLRESKHKPHYVDCNAVNSDTVRRVGAIIEATGCVFVDASIIGGPPRAGYDGPVFYASGPEAPAFETLGRHGLVIKVMPGPIGHASDLKMAYGGLTKGLDALGAILALVTTRAGIAEPFYAELEASQPQLLTWLSHGMPGMYAKAYRWVGEMNEVARFTDSQAGHDIFTGIADFYDRMARDFEQSKEDVGVLMRFFEK